MPTYEYRCANGHEFERFQRMSEAPVDSCPTCGAPAERLMSAGALLFKGSGFYITDYRADSYKKAAESDKGGASTDKGGDSKSQSKSNSKASDSSGSSSTTGGGSSAAQGE